MSLREQTPPGEPSREVIAMRDAIFMIAASLGKLDEAATHANAMRAGMPAELLPMVQRFNEGDVETTEIIAAWMEIGGRQAN